MLRAMAIAACLLAAYVTVTKAEDDLDARIARIERENAQLKKMLKVQDLERENAALRARVDSGRSNVTHAPAAQAASAAPAVLPVHTRAAVPASAGNVRVDVARHEASEAFAKYVPQEPSPKA